MKKILFAYATHDSPTSIVSQIPEEYVRHIEWDEQRNIDTMVQSLSKVCDVEPLEFNLQFFDEVLKRWPGGFNAAFPYVEGLFGPSRESLVPALFENLRTPIVGSSSVVTGVCQDKYMSRQMLRSHNVEVPRFYCYPLEKAPTFESRRFVIKPRYEGSSMGVKIVDTTEIIARTHALYNEYQQPVLVDEYLGGEEFSVGWVGNGSDTEFLPIIRIDYSKFPNGYSKLYDLHAKEILDKEAQILECPAQINGHLRARLYDVAARAISALELRDYGRLDVRLDRLGMPRILEVNTIPGMLPDIKCQSLFPIMWYQTDRTYDDLIKRLVETAERRWASEPC